MRYSSLLTKRAGPLKALPQFRAQQQKSHVAIEKGRHVSTVPASLAYKTFVVASHAGAIPVSSVKSTVPKKLSDSKQRKLRKQREKACSRDITNVLARSRVESSRTDGQNGALRQFMITTSTPQNTTKEHVLAELGKVYAAGDRCRDSGKERGVVILATPTFTQFLEDETFLSRVMDIIFKHDASSPLKLRTVRSFTAVVDGLPMPTGLHTFNDTTEGFAFLVGEEESIMPGIRELIPVTATVTPGMKSLELQVFHNAYTPDSIALASVHATIPLANTLFRNGKVVTQSLSLWARPSEEEPFERKQHNHVESQVIRPSPISRCPQFFKLPVVALTPFREVVSGLGNIIRQVADSEGKPQPASTELEKVVDLYLKAKKMEKQAVSVWAVVIPPEMMSAEYYSNYVATAKVIYKDLLGSRLQQKNVREFWTGSKGKPQLTALSHLIKHGAKLHRVVSGGGGWGPKAGLLSLDPLTRPTDTIMARDDFDTPESASLDHSSRTLKDVARPGSMIQFLINVEPPRAKKLAVEHPSISDRKPVMTTVVGCMPSTIDDLPANYSTNPNETTSSTLGTHLGLFGAMSEAGVYLHTTPGLENMIKSRHPDVVRSHLPGSGEGQPMKYPQFTPVLETKLDVPLGMFLWGAHEQGPRTIYRSLRGSSPSRQKLSKNDKSEGPQTAKVEEHGNN